MKSKQNENVVSAKNDSAGFYEEPSRNAEGNTETTVAVSDSKSRLRSLVRQLSLRFIAAFVLMMLFAVIIGVLGIESGGAGMDTPIEYVATYVPFLLAIGLLARKFPMTKPDQTKVLWPHPTVPQVISWILLTTGLACICQPSLIMASASMIRMFISLPEMMMVASFTGVLSFSTIGMVIVASIVEEYIFRRLIQDRLLFWGEGTAIVLASVFFALGHVTFSKIIGTFVCGLVFGYIHAKTGKMRWNIILHMSVNALSVLVECTYIVYFYILISAIFALIYLILKRPWKNLLSGDSGLSGGAKAGVCLTNACLWVCILCYVALMAMNIG